MNRHEKIFRRTRRALNILFVIWVLCIVGVYFAPSGIQDSDWRYITGVTVVVSIFAGIFVLGIVRIVAYMRWTGKYPYYFLSRSSRERVRKLREEHVNAKNEERLKPDDRPKLE